MPSDRIIFSDAPNGITAKKLNLLKAELEAEIAAGGGGTSTGDMLKSVYDTNANNKVDTCDSLPWTSVTGKPTTFPPDSTAMLKSVYDTNGDGISDHAAISDSVPWTGVTGKPGTFSPSPHAPTHVTGGTDVIPAPTTSASGLVPILPAVSGSAKFLDGTGVFNQVAYGNVTGTPAIPAASSTTPIMDGTGAVGVGTTYARNDHIHPSDTSRYAASNPSGYISGNQTITLSGDATGSGATAITTTLATVNANVGTFQGLTVNGKGLVTAATNQNYATSASVPLPASTTPVMDGAGAVGVGTTYARNDHVHPSDTSRVATTRLVSTSQSLTGGGDLSADRTLTLVGDSAAPGNSMFYGTNASGVRGWLVQATGTVNPGTWTNLTYSTGWTQNTTAQFRVEVNGTFSKVICQGIINYASGAASTAFTLPAGARPAVTRGCSLAGFDSTADVMLFSANVSTAGVVTILPIARQAFVWPSATNGSVYIDSLVFSL